MKTRTTHAAPDLPDHKRVFDIYRIVSRILADSDVSDRNRTDEQGRKQGYWVEWDASGYVFEGTYVDGKMHGHGVFRTIRGDVLKGHFVDGKKHGHWVERYASGVVFEGAYVDDKKHGHWVARRTDGSVIEYCWGMAR